MLLGFVLNTSVFSGEASQYKTNCNDNFGADCSRLGLMYESGREVKKSESKAVKYYQKACDLDNGWGCSLLGDLTLDGRGGLKESNSKAAQHYQKSCDLNHDSGCFNLAFLYKDGRGVENNNSEASKYYAKYCQLKLPLDCRNDFIKLNLP